jgi:predicted transcriptional regulator of viral defense system
MQLGRDAAELADVDRMTAARLRSRCAEQGWLKRLRRGVHSRIAVDALTAERTLHDPWVLVLELFAPGYV